MITAAKQLRSQFGHFQIDSVKEITKLKTLKMVHRIFLRWWDGGNDGDGGDDGEADDNSGLHVDSFFLISKSRQKRFQMN